MQVTVEINPGYKQIQAFKLHMLLWLIIASPRRQYWLTTRHLNTVFT